MNGFAFALPSGYDWDVQTFTKQVKTKAWAKRYQSKLSKYSDKFTNANANIVQIIGGMLQAAYGANIGRQIEEKLKPEDFAKIRANILSVVYGGNWK